MTHQHSHIPPQESVADRLNRIRQTPTQYRLDDTKPKFKDIPGTFLHTSPDDPYFSPEAVQSRAREVHPPYMNFLGPHTEFEARMIGKNGDFYKTMMEHAGLNPRGTYPYDKPYNEVDRCAMEHDRVFTSTTTTKEEARAADDMFRECLKKVKSVGVYSMGLKQLANAAIATKTTAEDLGVIPKASFSSAAGISDEENQVRNQSLKMVNSTISGTQPIQDEDKAEDAEDKLNFFFLTLEYFFRVGLNTFPQMATTMLFRKAKNTNYDISARLPTAMGNLFLKIASKMRRNTPVQMITAGLLGTSEFILSEFAQELFPISDLFTDRAAEMAVRFGANKAMLYLIDNYFTWFSNSVRSDEWKLRNTIDVDELNDIYGQQTTYRQEMQARADVDFTDTYGLSINNDDLKIVRKAMRNIANQTPRQKLRHISKILSTLRNIALSKPGLLQIIRAILRNPDPNMYLELQRLGENYSLSNIKSILSRQMSLSDVQMIMGSSARQDLRLPRQFGLESDSDMRLRLLNTNYLEFFNSMSLLQRFDDFFN